MIAAFGPLLNTRLLPTVLRRFSSSLKFSKEHEWVKIEASSKVAQLGITDHAQSELGDIVYVKMPEVESVCQKEECIGEIESVKAVSNIYTPVSGKVVEVNDSLEEDYGALNTDPLENWLCKIEISDPKEIDGLMTEDEYKKFVASLSN